MISRTRTARKPASPTDLTKPSWRHVARTTLREYLEDQCLDLAAGLTFRMVLSTFPALIALVSMLSLVGQSGSVETVIGQAEAIVPSDTWNTVEPALSAVLTAPAPGLGLVLGLVIALWTASGYTKAFGRAMNGIYDVPEGRGLIKINVQMYLLTALLLALGAVALVIFVVSGPIAEFVGGLFGLSGTAVALWNVAKWFVLAGVVIGIVALLYYATPNVEQPRFRWISIGAAAAIVASVLATLGFFFYVTNFGTYNATYGALAGVIVLLLWLYIVNVALLLGAEIDAELERSRELQAGLPAERRIQLPPRDTSASDARKEKYEKDLERARALRESTGRTDDPAEAPAPAEAPSPGEESAPAEAPAPGEESAPAEAPAGHQHPDPDRDPGSDPDPNPHSDPDRTPGPAPDPAPTPRTRIDRPERHS